MATKTTDVSTLISREADEAVDQIIIDSRRLNRVVNGTGIEQVQVEDGSMIPTIRKAFLDSLIFKTPPLPWRNGTSVVDFNQLYSFTDPDGNVAWWYAPGATTTAPITQRDTPLTDTNFKIYLDKSNIEDIYAPLISPNFTGNPRVPNPSSDDYTNTIAPTSWVKDRVKEVADKISELGGGDFENITVAEKALVTDLEVTGGVRLSGTSIEAPLAHMSLNRLTLQGNDSELSFSDTGIPPIGISTPSKITPFQISTGELSVDTLSTKKAEVGDLDEAGDSLSVAGFMRGDYLHLEGNDTQDVDRPQLIVDGIATVGKLRVTDGIEGYIPSVDGRDIRPRSVETTNHIRVGENLQVSGTTELTGDTRVTNLAVSGTLTGVTFSVDGRAISPSSVTTPSASITGNLSVGGRVTTKDLSVSGSVSGITPEKIGALSKASNLSDIGDKKTSRKNLAVDYQVSTSEPPASAVGYEEGFIWYQVEA